MTPGNERDNVVNGGSQQGGGMGGLSVSSMKWGSTGGGN